MSTSTLPSYVTKYFWGDNLNELNIEKHRSYIIETLLNIGDRQSLKWLFSIINRETIKKMLPSLKLDKKSSHFWQLYMQ